ncbi:hypothetical protein [Mucilaginibacter lacusdianchii]|uniref:hypothetical protein n=1 Tax=Mucilaginibacter lacusdianchii TaxID=2684211 RepID=UPI00131E7FC1|nr:hypothetical protein [Mucilaginibacter sp. JXJ CY 39]
MRLFWFYLLACIVSFNTQAQSIKYQKSFQSALLSARQSHKLIFVNIEVLGMTSNRPPNLPALKYGIEDKAVVNLYNNNFINIKAFSSDSNYIAFIKKYSLQINAYPAYFFLDEQGNLLYKGIAMMSTQPDFYLKMAENALKTARSDRTISNYESLRQQGKLTTAQFKDYISLKQELGLYNNAQLIDEYLNNLPVKAFDDYQEVLFILKAGPLAFGKAYNFAYSNRKVADSVYKHEPVEIRKAINNRIIVNTRNEAIRTKNAVLAQQVSNFIRNTWYTNYNQGSKAASDELIYYYYAVKDTANYYRQASFHYDNYYMRLSADSIQKLKQQALDNMKKANAERIKQIHPNAVISDAKIVRTTPTSGKITQTITAVSSGGTSDVATVLNNAAYNFYVLGTRNPDHLTKAMLWSKRSIDLSPDVYAFYDTLAHILYRLGFYDEAISRQKKAVELAAHSPTASNQVSNLKKELEKIRDHKL